MSDSINKIHSSDMLPDRHRSNSYDYQPKRVRKGSISGRLRTASDLEELGYIDKAQKGLIKDLIISGDTKLQALMDKYEQGDGYELLALIKDGYLSMRKPSIELIEGLDFDFINALRDDDDEEHNDGGFFADLDADFGSSGVPTHISPKNHKDHTGSTAAATSINKKERRGSTDDVADLLQNHNRSRRATLDALLLHNFIFDDHLGQLTSGDDLLMHDYGVHGEGDAIGGSNDVFNDLFHQFSSATGGGEGLGAVGGGSNIDLSAYAQHAATLQQSKHPLPTSALGKNSQLAQGTDGTINAGKAGVSVVATSAGTSSSKKPGSTAAGNFSHPPNTYLYNPGHNSGGNSGFPSTGYPSNTTLSNLQNPNVLTNNGPYGLGGQGQIQPGMSVSASAMNAAAQRPSGFIGAYSPEQRRQRIEKFLEKRARRVWSRKVKYDVRKNFADSRLRIKGRFVKKEDEDMMRELMNI